MITVYCHEVRHWNNEIERVYYYFEYQLDIWGKKHRKQIFIDEQTVFEELAEGAVRLFNR